MERTLSSHLEVPKGVEKFMRIPSFFLTMNHRRRHSRNVQKEDNTFSSVDSLLIQFCA